LVYFFPFLYILKLPTLESCEVFIVMMESISRWWHRKLWKQMEIGEWVIRSETEK